jgi:tetratricopeptide (TPR) repeat protein
LFGQYGKDLDALLLQVKDASYYDSVRVFEAGEKAIALAKKESKLAAIPEVYLYYGSYFFYVRNLTKADEYFKKAIKTAQESQNDHIALRAQIRLAYLDFELGQTEKSTEQLKRFLLLAKSKKDFDKFGTYFV